MSTKELLKKELVVVNVGAEVFAESLRRQGVKTIHVAWQPPAGGDKELAKLLEKVK
jgi:hypothetical protein